ncbi:hypothetical protein J3F83DRAFT_54939 [Trichoderma novae-zelandiae]
MPPDSPRAPRPPGPYNLGPFETPGRPYRLSHIHAWNKVGLSIGTPDHLWGPLWRRFNTIQIPIFGEVDYFNHAMEIAKLANGNAEEFERIYTQRNKERMGELLDLLMDAAQNVHRSKKTFPCQDAREKILAVCRTGSLEDFARLLKGVTFGWEADTTQDAPSDDSPEGSNEEMHPVVEPNPYGYDSDDIRLTAHYHSLCPTAPTQRLKSEYDYYYPRQRLPREVEEMAKSVIPLGVVFDTRSTEAASEDAAEATESTLYETADEAPPPPSSHASCREEYDGKVEDGKGKQAQSTPNPDDCQHQGDISRSLAPPPISRGSFPTQPDTDKELTSVRPGMDDAGNNDPMDQRPQSSPGRSAGLSASSSSERPQNGSVATKRARPEDESDEDHTDGDRSPKRRKMEKSPPPQAAEGAGRRHGKEKDSSPRFPRAKLPASSTTNTRSRRGNGASSLWELDHVGKPRSIP